MRSKWPMGIIQTLLLNNNNISTILNVASSEVINDNFPENIFKYNNNYAILETSDQLPDSFLEIELKAFSLSLKAYRIRSSYHSQTASHLKSWDLYGSNDQNDWTLIDRVENEYQLNGSNYEMVFPIKNTEQSFKYIKLCNVTTYYLEYKIMISEFDIYDTMFSPLIHQKPCTLGLFVSYQISQFFKLTLFAIFL